MSGEMSPISRVALTGESIVCHTIMLGPNFGFPHGDARLNLTDLYAFPKPGGDRKSILSSTSIRSTPFRPAGASRLSLWTDALNKIKIHKNGDAVADVPYRVRFRRLQAGPQLRGCILVEGSQAAQKGAVGQVNVAGAPPRLIVLRAYRIYIFTDSSSLGAVIPSYPTRWAPERTINTGKDFFTKKTSAHCVSSPVLGAWAQRGWTLDADPGWCGRQVGSG